MVFELIFIFYLISFANGSFNLYNTKLSNNIDYRDCLYSFILHSDKNEWQLVPYCIRHNGSNSNYADNQCYDSAQYTFEQLKLKNINSYDLYEWNAPIDTINEYQKYLIVDDLLLGNHHYCNCTGNWFGTQCQYMFAQFGEAATFDEVILFQFDRKRPLATKYEIVNDPSMLTCYEGLRCHLTMCLDWRQICDGVLNCASGEDEPVECLLLETHECENHEYRCRNGMCIPKTFLIDFSYDCADLSDETAGYRKPSIDFECYSAPTLVCDFRLCPLYTISCSDGQCAAMDHWILSCDNGRDLFFYRNFLSPALSTNVSYECWFIMLCKFNEKSRYIFGYEYDDCEYSSDSEESDGYFESFQKYCPTSFFLNNEGSFDHSFVQFLYYNITTYSRKWWHPTHICYNKSRCHNLPVTELPLVNDLLCIKDEGINSWIDDPVTVRMLFSACSLIPRPQLSQNKQLFFCDISMKFISKHRVRDNVKDCYFNEDEYDDDVNTAIMRSLNLSDRFKCLTRDEWFPRPLIGGGICRDGSDTLFIGHCKKGPDLGCQFLRGLSSLSIYYMFRDNCDGFSTLKFLVENETDETSCEEWPQYRCDDIWETSNGEDELNCSDTIVSYITRQVFKCSANEHYCAHPNGTMGCLSKQRAGDGIVDCLGATDERTTFCDFPNPIYPFHCSNSKECVSVLTLCDSIIDCLHNDDDLACRWSYNFTCRQYEFTCKNGTCIDKKKQCNNVIDCQPDGEDEWFCDLTRSRAMHFGLGRIHEYPSVIIDSPSTDMKIVTTLRLSPSLPVNNTRFKSEHSLSDWFCNRGIIVTTRSSQTECLCPPSYYGSRCEYQSERLLITLRIDISASMSGQQKNYNVIRIVACLMLDDVAFHHEEILHVLLMKQMFYLNYPQPPPKQPGNWSVRFDAFSVTTSRVDFKGSWLFDVPFSFLPVSRLVLHLTLKDPDTCDTVKCVHGRCKKYLNPPHHPYCQCEENWLGKHCNTTSICSCAGSGKCLARQITPICVCPLGRMGSECQAFFNPCKDIKCQNGGSCLPLDERLSKKFICSCRVGYSGSLCEVTDALIDIHFSESLSSYNVHASAAVIVYFLRLYDETPGVLFIQNRQLHTQVQLNKPLRIFNNNYQHLSTFILLQIFFEPDNFDYYIAAVIKNNLRKLTTTIYKSYRCSHVDVLLLNTTIRGFSSIKKVKYYHYICKMNDTIYCFIDETYLCFCDKYGQPDCLVFPNELTQCTTDYCQNDGRCVQNSWNGLWYFGCVCSGCTYGSLCQLTTSEYTLSLDMMLGSDIFENETLINQPFFIKFVVAVFILMLSFGFMSNLLSLMTFKQPKVQEVGCGIYLFCLPLVGQLGLFMIVGRFFYLLTTQLYNVHYRSAARWSCICLEYFLTVCPMLFDWLTACVAVERCLYMIMGISFKKSNSVWWAKRIVFLVIIVVMASVWYEPLIRQLIDDPRSQILHTWCVIVFPWPWVQYYRLIVNMINLVIPSSISLFATIFLLHKSTRMKQMFARKTTNKSYLMLFKKQLPLYGSPLGLVALSLIRLIFSFTLICITHQWQKYVYLSAYIISFIPLMGTFPIFVLPAKIYKTEFKNFLNRTGRKLRRTQFNHARP